MKLRTCALLLAISCSSILPVQQKEQGTVIAEVEMNVSPDLNSQKLAKATRGRDVPLVMERTKIGEQTWAHVLIVVGVDRERETTRQITGWVPSNVVISTATPNGDQIIFGEAVDSQNQAEQRGGRKHAAEDAMRLYYRVYDYWPNSPISAEALWRAADIRWQLEKADVRLRPSSREMSPDLRTPIDDENMKLVMKKYPHSKWSDLAAYDLLDGKMCPEWRGQAECPMKEAALYEQYAHEHPQSPKAAEALYNAAWRQASLADIYRINNDRDKSEAARKNGIALAQEIASQYPQGDWKPRALDLIYKLEKKIPIYSAAVDAGDTK